MSTGTTLVLGGTGKTGRRVVERLTARGLPVRSGSRSGAPAFDWEDQGSWPAALEGVEAVYISYYPDLAAPGAVPAIEALTGLAVAKGVRRLVLLSGRGEAEAQRCERVVRAAGVEWTIVRASWFAQNFSESYLLEPILAGEVALPVGAVGEPFVDADDIAEIAANALVDDGHVGELYEVTGPRLWTFEQAVAEIARTTGRPIAYAQVSPQDYESALVAAQLPPALVSLIMYLFTEVLDGRNANTTDGVQRALGRPPREFASYVAGAVAAGSWKA